MEAPSSNPLLAAEARKESVLPRSIITPTPPTNVSRNPFKKSTTPRYEQFRKNPAVILMDLQALNEII